MTVQSSSNPQGDASRPGQVKDQSQPTGIGDGPLSILSQTQGKGEEVQYFCLKGKLSSLHATLVLKIILCNK